MFNWLCTYLCAYLKEDVSNNVSVSSMYLKLFLIMFTLGGSTGLIMGNSVLDISLHDSYYVISHFHIVLSLGTLLSILIGVYYYEEYLLSFIFSITNILSVYHTKALFIGILVTFMPQHFLSFITLPRRISDFPDSLNCWNSLSSLGCSLTWVCFFVLSRIPMHLVASLEWVLAYLSLTVCWN